MNNLSVLIGSCDSYNSLWKSFQICFDRYWKFDTKNYIVTEKMDVPNYTDTEFITVKGISDPWAKRMIDGINAIDTDFIFFILEDYFLDYSYDSKKINNWLSDMDKYNINRLQISPGGHQIYKKVEGIPYEQIDERSNYLISMQPSIWRKDFLLKTLNPTYSAWEYEIKGSYLLQNKEKGVFIDKSIGNVYFNAVRRGFKKSKGWDEFMKKEGLC